MPSSVNCYFRNRRIVINTTASLFEIRQLGTTAETSEFIVYVFKEQLIVTNEFAENRNKKKYSH